MIEISWRFPPKGQMLINQRWFFGRCGARRLNLWLPSSLFPFLYQQSPFSHKYKLPLVNFGYLAYGREYWVCRKLRMVSAETLCVCWRLTCHYQHSVFRLIMDRNLLRWGYRLTHLGRVTQIWFGNKTTTDSDDGLAPGWLIGIHTFSFKKGVWKCRLQNGGHVASASMC